MKAVVADKQTKPSIMWLISLSISSILVIITINILSTSTNNNIVANGNFIFGNNNKPTLRPTTHRRHSVLSRAAKQMKKITKDGIKLIDKKNIARGAEGTVVKDLDRGTPLKGNLPEDTDEGYADDQWYEDEDTYEEKQLEEIAKKKLESDVKAKAEEKSKETTNTEDEGNVSGDSKKEGNANDEEKNDASTAEDETTIEDATKKDIDKRCPAWAKAGECTKNPNYMNEHCATSCSKNGHTIPKKKKKAVPRVWESNALAVMKIIDTDAHPHVEITSDGKLISNEEEDDSSSSDSSSDSEDSSDDTEDEYEKSEKKKHRYIPLPNLATMEPEEAATALLSPESGIPFPLHKRMVSMFETAKTHECRAMIAEHMALFVNGFAEETKFPFEDFHYPNTCEAIPRYGDWDNLPAGVKIADVQYRTYQPPKEDAPKSGPGSYIENVEDLQLLYVILTHDQPEAAIRLIESVYVPGVTKYVIHVDGKEKADPTYKRLVEYAKEMNDKSSPQEIIRIVPNEKRVRVNWGGFTMVQATLHALHTVFGLDYYDKNPSVEGGDKIDNPHAFTFHKLVHLASTTYPLASNTEIRDTFASYPLDANFLHIILRPNNPTPSVWNYFVECDDALHRIYRIPALNFDRGNGVDIYTSSQWFIISHEFAWYLAKPPKDSFVEYYLEYIEHVVVADEAFFGTVIRNTYFCSTLHNDNFLHLQFDRWENEAVGARDQRKCVMKNRDHCGRSPTTMTVDYLPVLELSGDLFARKFDDVEEPFVKDYIDRRREKEEERLLREAELMKEMKKNGTETPELPLEEWEFQGEGVLIVAKETVHDDVPLCMGLSAESNQVQLRPCFKDDVPPTLSPEWEAGAVIIEEVNGFNRWDIGPCSSDGELKRNATGELEMTPGHYSEKGPSCGIKIGDGPRMGRCMDVESDHTEPGGALNVFPCYTKWHQLFSFGNGTIAPRGAIHASLPLHMARQMQKKNSKKKVHQHLCIGVEGRGDMEETWIQWTEEEANEIDPWEHDDVERYDNGRKSLQLWSGQQLQTTPCTNTGGVLEFFFVPFIVEEYDDEENESIVENETGSPGIETTEDDEEL